MAPPITLAPGLHGEGQASLWHVRGCPGNHADAVDDGADAEAQGTARAGVPHAGQVGLGVKLDGLRTERETILSQRPLQVRDTPPSRAHQLSALQPAKPRLAQPWQQLGCLRGARRGEEGARLREESLSRWRRNVQPPRGFPCVVWRQGCSVLCGSRAQPSAVRPHGRSLLPGEAGLTVGVLSSGCSVWKKTGGKG